MRCIRSPNNDGVLIFEDTADPLPGPDDVRIRVTAAGVNRLDILQKFGKYPVPPGESDILGVECAGVVEDVGDNIHDFRVGDRVCALVGGGGYAQKVISPASQLIRSPHKLTDEEACAIRMSYLGETVLVHAGGSGVGTAAIQLVRQLLSVAPGNIICTVGSAEKAEFCKSIGADHAINYKTKDFAEEVKSITGGKGVDVILDFIGGPYFDRNIDCLRLDGRLVLLGLLGGFQGAGPVNTGAFLRKRATVIGSTLRNRPAEYKAQLVRDFSDRCASLFLEGKLRPIVHAVLPWEDVNEAHGFMERNENIGKLILAVK